jgi:hypothetical protein
VSLGVGSGFKARLDDVAGAYEVPLGLLAQLAVTPRLMLGASWVHGKFLGGPDVAGTGLDGRAVNVWLVTTQRTP